MNYWIIIKRPPNDGEDPESFGIRLKNKKEQAGADIEIGDRVLIYQTKTGRSELKNIKGKTVVCRPTRGRQGIMAIAEVIGDLEELGGSIPSKYTNGKDVWWRWHADTYTISMNGFVSRFQVNQILGYKTGYTLRAFGDRKSGLKKLSENQYNALLAIFKKHPRKIDLIRKAKKKGDWEEHDKGGESEEHRLFKEYVASNPAVVLDEPGLETVKIEYPFVSGDKADIVFKDADGNIIGAEIETNVEGTQIAGVLQAIKYRYMLALTEERKYFETRAFLIAKSIPKDIIDLCEEYEVKCFVVKVDVVNQRNGTPFEPNTLA